MNDYIIETHNLTKKYGSQTSVSHLNIHVKKGRIYGLLGRNGAGKTTTMRMLLGLTAPTSGEVTIFGKPFHGNEKNILPHIGCLIESPGFYPNLTGTENLKIFAELRGLRSPKYIKNALELVNLPYRDKKLFSQYSLGMKQKLGLAQAIMEEPSLLILDEPLDGLDPVMRKQIWTILMSEVAERRTTVLVSSHNLRELEDVCDHVGIMNHGKVIIERSLFDLHGNISKIQVACQTGMPKLPKEFEVLHMSNSGRVYTMIVKGNPREVAAAIQTEGDHLAIVDILPLTLEEIFIYEMGGLGYEVKDILF